MVWKEKFCYQNNDWHLSKKREQETLGILTVPMICTNWHYVQLSLYYLFSFIKYQLEFVSQISQRKNIFCETLKTCGTVYICTGLCICE